MSYTAKEKAKRRYVCSIALFVLSFILLAICVQQGPAAEKVWNTYTAQKKVAAQIETENTIAKELSQKASNSGKTFESLPGKKDAYLAYLGDLATSHKLNIHKLTADDVKAVAGSTISYMPFEVEVQGDLADIEAYCADLYKSEKVMSIQKFSYRLDNQTYRWMWRAIDSNLLLSWWDISDYAGKSDDKNSSDAKKELSPLTQSALMQHSSALCYIQLDMIGSGG